MEARRTVTVRGGKESQTDTGRHAAGTTAPLPGS